MTWKKNQDLIDFLSLAILRPKSCVVVRGFTTELLNC